MEHQSANGQLLWNSGDARELSLTVNQTEYYSASSTSYPDGVMSSMVLMMATKSFSA